MFAGWVSVDDSAHGSVGLVVVGDDFDVSLLLTPNLLLSMSAHNQVGINSMT